MSKYYVPILAIRHAYALVEAESERDALVKGWETITAHQCRWLYETASVEKPFRKLTEEDIDWEDLPEDLGAVSINQPQTYVSQLLHPHK